MDWIKKHYDQFSLALLATVLLASAVFLYLNTQSFGEKFTEAQNPIPEGDKVPVLELTQVDAAKSALEKPPTWTSIPDSQTLFVSQLYIAGPNGPKKPIEGERYSDTFSRRPMPNKWFLDNRLNLLDPTVPLQDPDGDGFTNEDEWRAAPQTDPQNKQSHPPYHTKLFLKQFIKVPFRLILRSYDGDVKKDKPETFSFQIDTIDYRQPSGFLQIGEVIPKTKFKIKSFQYKTVFNPEIADDIDVSELTLTDMETGDSIVLVLNRVTDSPDTFALFDYQWPQPPADLRVRKLGEFALKPNVTERYKLVDIKETEALIQLPTGENYTVIRDPRKR